MLQNLELANYTSRYENHKITFSKVNEASYLHVEHVVRLLHPVQVQTTLRGHYEQGRHCQQQLRRGVDERL